MSVQGVHRHPARKKNPFQARIQVAGKFICLGSHPTEASAHAAYLAAKEQHRRPRAMRNRDVCSFAEVSGFLRYEPSTGQFFWKVSRRPTVKAADAAGTINSRGYLQICMRGRAHLGHRIAWLLTHGHWPTKMIDHINGARSDNRLENLREATGAQNQANRAARKDSKSGMRGVRFDKKTGKWAAQLQIGGFDTPEEARSQFMHLAKFCYGEFAPTAARVSAIWVARDLKETEG